MACKHLLFNESRQDFQCNKRGTAYCMLNKDNKYYIADNACPEYIERGDNNENK